MSFNLSLTLSRGFTVKIRYKVVVAALRMAIYNLPKIATVTLGGQPTRVKVFETVEGADRGYQEGTHSAERRDQAAA